MQAEHSITIKIAQGQASIRTLAQLKKELTASDAQADKLEEAIKDVDRALDGMGREAVSSARSVDRLTKENKQLERQLERVDRSSTRTFGTMAGLLGGISFVFLAQQLKHVSDEIGGLESRIADVTKTSGDYNQVLEKVIDSADSAGVKLNTTATLFTRLSMGRDELGATNEQIITLGETVQKLGVLSGATQKELDGALLQFSQSMSSGIVQGQEFNSIMEQAPAIFIEVAKQMKTTTGALRSTMLAGDLLAKDVFDALMKSTDDVNQRFKDMGDFAYQAENRLSNAFKLVVRSVDEASGATQFYIGVINEAAVSIRGLSDAMRKYAVDTDDASKSGADGFLWVRDVIGFVADEVEDLTRNYRFFMADWHSSIASIQASAQGMFEYLNMRDPAQKMAELRRESELAAHAYQKSYDSLTHTIERFGSASERMAKEIRGLSKNELTQLQLRATEIRDELKVIDGQVKFLHPDEVRRAELLKQELEQINKLVPKNDKAPNVNTAPTSNPRVQKRGAQAAPRYDNLDMLDQLREYHMGELEQINKHHQDRVNAALALNLSEQQIAQAGFESRAALNAEIIKLSEQRREKEFDILSEAAGKKFTDKEARLQQQRDMMERSHKEMLNSFKIRRADQLEAEGRIAEAGKLRREAEVEQLRLHQASKLADLKAAKDEELLTTEEYAQRKAEIEIQYAEEVARTKAELEEQATRAKLEQVSSQVGVMGDFYGNLAQLAGKNSREQRALMIAQSTMAAIQTGINTRNTATASGIPEPGPAILGGIAFAAQMAQVQQLKSQSVGSYEQGGFIPGTSYRGDNLVANVNSGEAVLNAGQQREFMRLANGGGATNSAPVFNFYGLPAQPKVTRNEQGGYDFDFTDAFRDMLDSPEGDRVFTSAVRKVS